MFRSDEVRIDTIWTSLDYTGWLGLKCSYGLNFFELHSLIRYGKLIRMGFGLTRFQNLIRIDSVRISSDCTHWFCFGIWFEGSSNWFELLRIDLIWNVDIDVVQIHAIWTSLDYTEWFSLESWFVRGSDWFIRFEIFHIARIDLVWKFSLGCFGLNSYGLYWMTQFVKLIRMRFGLIWFELPGMHGSINFERLVRNCGE